MGTDYSELTLQQLNTEAIRGGDVQGSVPSGGQGLVHVGLGCDERGQTLLVALQVE